MLLALMTTLALAGPVEKSDKLGHKAHEAFEAGDLSKALKLSEKALRLNPDNALAHFTRARLALIAYGRADAEVAPILLQSGLEDMGACARLEPTWTCAGMYLDLLATTMGGSLLPEHEITCSPESIGEIQEAERLFNLRQLDAAKPHYERAIALCPAQPAWPTWYGDVYFAAGDMQTAISWYEEALKVDPCFPSARRFRSDALLQLGDLRGAYDEGVRTVACDPTYETGWSHLQSIVQAGGGAWERARVQKPAVTSTAEGATVGLSLQPGDPFGGGIGALYGVSLQGAVGSPLQQERAAVRAVLEMVGQSPFAPDAPPELWLWRQLAIADGAGYLDEAIFVYLLDEALVPEFLEYRVANFQRLQDYIARYVTPLP